MPVTVPPSPEGRETRARRAARAALVDVLWNARGQRRLPREAALTAALEACDARDVWWVCEANSAGPVYLLPTREWLRALARVLDGLGARRVLEVAAGDGFLATSLARVRPDLQVRATDDMSWAKPAARMTKREQRAQRHVRFAGIAPMSIVERSGAVAAVKRLRPDVTVVSWAPPGTLVERVIRAPTRYVLDISVDGDVCGNGARTWRYPKEFLEGPIEDRALCRLDARPHAARATRVTLYYGASFPKDAVPRA